MTNVLLTRKTRGCRCPRRGGRTLALSSGGSFSGFGLAASCSDGDDWIAALRDGEAAELEEEANAPLELCPCSKRRRRDRPKKRVAAAQSSKATMAARLPALQQRIGAVPWWSHATSAHDRPAYSVGRCHCRPPKLGEPHPLTTLVQEGFVRALAVPADDGHARQIASTLLGSTAVLTSGHSAPVDAMGTTRKMYLLRFYL